MYPGILRAIHRKGNMRKVILCLAVLSVCLFAGTARASWMDYGFNSYDDCMAAVNDYASCTDGSQPNPNDPPAIPTCPDGYVDDGYGNCVSNTPVPSSQQFQSAAPPDCSFTGGYEGWDPTAPPFGSIVLAGSTMTCNSPIPLETIAARWCITRDGSDKACFSNYAGAGVNELDLGILEWICDYTTYPYEWSAYAVGYATDAFGQTGYSPPTNWPIFSVYNAPNGWGCQ